MWWSFAQRTISSRGYTTLLYSLGSASTAFLYQDPIPHSLPDMSVYRIRSTSGHVPEFAGWLGILGLRAG